MSLSRPLTPYEKFFYGSQCMVQIAFDIAEPSYVTDLIDQLNSSVVGLHLKTDGQSLFTTKDPVQVMPIPHHLTTLPAATDYVAYECAPKLSDRLAVIGADRNRVVLSVSHMIADGGYLQYLVDKLREGRLPRTAARVSPIESFFEREMKSHGASARLLHVDPTLSRVYRKAAQPDAIRNPRAMYRQIRMPASQLSCYDKSTKKVHGLTEALWLATVMSSFCHNGKLGAVGCSTCINMRQYMPKSSIDLSVGNCYSSVSVNADYDDSITIAEMGRRMRSDFKQKVENGMQYEYMNAMMRDYSLKGLPGAGCEISNIGPLVIKDPIRDVHCAVSGVAGGDAPYYSFLSFSVQKREMNDVVVLVQYDPTYMTEKEIDAIEKGVRFLLRDVSWKTKFVDAYKEMQRLYAAK